MFLVTLIFLFTWFDAPQSAFRIIMFRHIATQHSWTHAHDWCIGKGNGIEWMHLQIYSKILYLYLFNAILTV